MTILRRFRDRHDALDPSCAAPFTSRFAPSGTSWGPAKPEREQAHRFAGSGPASRARHLIGQPAGDEVIGEAIE